jgi:hypothetical protein
VGKFTNLILVLRGGDPYKTGYDAGYSTGLDEGTDFGKRVAYNSTLAKEIPRILSRYAQLQVRVMNKPKKEVQAALEKFTQQEIDRFKMELQNR